jgi:two-component system response regulator QseB
MHILIVEDDRLIAENLYDFLESCGHQCDFATSLAAARALLADGGFDALVLDRNLPDGDGAMLARQLRSAGKMLPILMLTARDALDTSWPASTPGPTIIWPSRSL